MTVLQNDRFRVDIDPRRGARMVSLQIDGLEVLGSADPENEVVPSIGTGSYPMVPWAGRLRGHDMHGLGRDATWTHAGDGRFEAQLGEPWPDTGTARLTYELTDDTLTATLDWDTDGDQGCILGFHPWFRRDLGVGGGLIATIEPTVMVEVDAEQLPTGTIVDAPPGPWDDCLRLSTTPRLTWPGALTLELTSDADWWVVFDKSRDCVCVEPQTAPPDAFDHPALRPEGPWPSTVRLTLRAVSSPDTATFAG